MKGKVTRGGRVQQGIHHIIIRKKSSKQHPVSTDYKIIPAHGRNAGILTDSPVRTKYEGYNGHDNNPFKTQKDKNAPSDNSVLFLCNNDKTTFLRLLAELASKFQSKILAFILMDTHAHLLVESKAISIFIGTLCSRYARIYNKKYDTAGMLFLRTFISFVKDYEQWQVDTVLYILNNPVEAGICKRHKDYFFSSYKLHIGIPTSLSRIISIDNSLINKHFKTKTLFKAALNSKLKYQKHMAHIKYNKP